MIGNVDDIASYAVLQDSANILRRGLLGSSVIKKVSFINKQTKSHACRYFKTMEEGINPAFHARVVIERVAVKVAKLGSVPL